MTDTPTPETAASAAAFANDPENARALFEFGEKTLAEEREALHRARAELEDGLRTTLVLQAREVIGAAGHPKAKRTKLLKGLEPFNALRIERIIGKAAVEVAFNEATVKVGNMHANFEVERAAGLLIQRKLAAVAEVLQSEHWIYVAQTWVSTYQSQGFGAATYARNAAEGRADHFRHYGVEVDVVYVPGGPEVIEGYMVVAKLDSQVDVAIINARPGATFREQIKIALKRGVNIRVLNPYLPYGIEAKLGLDAFGNDLPGYTPDAPTE